MYNESWDKAENLMEENLGYSMREMRGNRELILSYQEKFSTKEILGRDCFSEIVEEMKDPKLSKIYLAEMCIQLDYLIKNIDVKKVAKAYFMNSKAINNLRKAIEDAKALWNLIKYNILPLEVFWSMEQSVEEGVVLTEQEEELYSYMIKVAHFYLGATEKLTDYIAYSKLEENAAVSV